MSCSFSVSFPRSICFSISSQVWNGGFSDPFGYFRPLFGNGPTNPAAVAQVQTPLRVVSSLRIVTGLIAVPRLFFCARRAIDVLLQAVAGQGPDVQVLAENPLQVLRVNPDRVEGARLDGAARDGLLVAVDEVLERQGLTGSRSAS